MFKVYYKEIKRNRIINYKSIFRIYIRCLMNKRLAKNLHTMNYVRCLALSIVLIKASLFYFCKEIY